MKKIIILVLIVTLSTCGAYYYYKTQNDQKNKKAQETVAIKPTSDLFYYDVRLKNGQHYVSKINNYPDGKIELYQIFIVVNNKMTPYYEYLEQKQREEKGGGLINYVQDPTITLSTADIEKSIKLPEDSATIKSINAYADKQNQETYDRLSTPPSE